MSVLKILYYPDKRLRTIANFVSKISENTKKIILDMFETMYSAQGIGLAATQVNIHQQIIVIDIHNNPKGRLVFINPVITKRTGITNTIEGCLSIPSIKAEIPRSKKITVKSLDQYGNTFEIEATNLLSICIQHEIDHLSGKLFIDYLPYRTLKKIHKNYKNINNNKYLLLT